MKRIKKLKSEINSVSNNVQVQITGDAAASAPTSNLLMIRHKFKLGFFSEMLRDTSRALKYYNQAYQTMQNTCNALQSSIVPLRSDDIRFVGTEFKTVCDYINFKICNIKAELRQHEDAINQFLSHIKWYKSMPGPIQGLFEHYALVYRQYRMFGELLESTAPVRADTHAVHPRYLSPGYYFFAAATAAITRRKCSENLRNDHSEPMKELRNDDEEEGIDVSNEDDCAGYVGQSGALMVQGQPNKQFLRLVLHEVQVNHSEIIIEMLETAKRHFSGTRLARMRQYIDASIGEEYMNCDQYEKAVRVLSDILPAYERWPSIATSILEKLVTCTRQLDSIRDCVMYSLQLVSDQFEYEESKREDLFQDLLSFFKNNEPNELFPFETPGSALFFEGTLNLVDVKLQFEQNHARVNDRIYFKVYLFSHAPEPIQFNTIQILFENSPSLKIAHGESLPVPGSPDQDDTFSVDLRVVPGTPTIVSFPQVITEQKDMKGKAVALNFAQSPGVLLYKSFDVAEYAEFAHGSVSYDHYYEIHQGDFVERPYLKVLPPRPSMTLSLNHHPPALIHEYYSLSLLLQANSDNIQSGRLSFHSQDDVQVFRPGSDGVPVPVEQVGFPAIPPGSSHHIDILVQSPSPHAKLLNVRAVYSTDLFHNYEYEDAFEIFVQYPFDWQFFFTATRSAPAQRCFVPVPDHRLTFKSQHKDAAGPVPGGGVTTKTTTTTHQSTSWKSNEEPDGMASMSIGNDKETTPNRTSPIRANNNNSNMNDNMTPNTNSHHHNNSNTSNDTYNYTYIKQDFASVQENASSSSSSSHRHQHHHPGSSLPTPPPPSSSSSSPSPSPRRRSSLRQHSPSISSSVRHPYQQSSPSRQSLLSSSLSPSSSSAAIGVSPRNMEFSESSSDAGSRDITYATSFPAGEPIVMTSLLTACMPFPVKLHRIVLQLSKSLDMKTPEAINVRNNTVDMVSQSFDLTPEFSHKQVLERGDVFSVCHVIQAKEGEVKAGQLHVTCSRSQYASEQSNHSVSKEIVISLPLPIIPVSNFPVAAALETPDRGKVGETFELNISLHNNTALLQEITLTADDNAKNEFAMTGGLSRTITILPHSDSVMQFRLLPLMCGMVNLPKFTVSSNRSHTHVLYPKETWNIFIEPNSISPID
eukprot:gb/GECH01010062.1/.p1 GENE.gb/GECH01010062.1/~~gb/GECH01010062.1/.p1  ORF type:complete len:1149 (+),score=251.10 gb/GECH01010062.1/:1-3447(+)